MRFSLATILTFVLASGAFAQPSGPPVKILRVPAGFRSQGPIADAPGRFKVGLWTPISVDVQAGPKGLPNCDLIVETPDSENVATHFTVPIGQLDKHQQRTVLTYAKPGNSEGRFNFTIRTQKGELLATSASSQFPLDLRGRIYLTLGSRLDLQKVFTDPEMRRRRPELGQEQDKDDTFPRFAAFETDPDRLPALALGYDAVDLMILTTAGDPKFLQRLRRDNDGDKLKAIAGWVRQGGRLIVSVSWKNQPEVHELLKSPAWQPPLPVVPPADTPGVEKNPLREHQNVPFPRPMPVALLQPTKVERPEWEVTDRAPDGRVIVGTMPYGRGSVTLVAFELEKEPFSSWNNRTDFLKDLIRKREPTVPPADVNMNEKDFGNSDLSTQLQTTLDQFDVPIIPFGWVALFIIVYIIIVGPLDYLLLKKVFKSLEWTWITFPTVVILVSAVAYFTAYAVKGRDMKINKVDLVDFDLRTELNDKLQPKGAYAYGNTWFTIMSPQIKSYTIGIEPVVAEWWRGKAKEPHSAEVVSWLGRPEFDGFGAMGSRRSQGWSRRSYDYGADGTSLSGVSIPVWTTKSFAATWEMPLPRLPVKADLVFHHAPNDPVKLQDPNRKVSGTIQSFLPADLHDVWIFYEGHCYPLEGTLNGKKTGGEQRTIALGIGQDIMGWANSGGVPQTKSAFSAAAIVKEICFHKKVDNAQLRRNQALNRLDFSWRIQEKRSENSLRDAILFGRLAPLHGNPEDLAANNPLPSLLWLDDVPGSGNPRPRLSGVMNQETFIRIILPVRKAP
jgi:hypothetical protein